MREDEDITRLLFLLRERAEVSRLFIIRLELEVERPIEASLLRELEREDVEKTDFIRPFMLPFLSREVEEPLPPAMRFCFLLSLKLFCMSEKSSSMLLSISLRKVLIEAFLADSLT